MDAPKRRYISPEERQQIIDELRLVQKKMYILRNYWWVMVSIKRKKKGTYLHKKDNKLLMN